MVTLYIVHVVIGRGSCLSHFIDCVFNLIANHNLLLLNSYGYCFGIVKILLPKLFLQNRYVLRGRG